MSIELYASCPCGSGKKFKWCCQPIHAEIEKAFAQQEAGQHENALRTVEDVVQAHPTNPEAWGRKAQILHLNGRAEEAEKALEEAFKLNKNYAFGYLLQGMFRQSEGEPVGAAILFRKASELYPPDSAEQLSFLFEQIGDAELGRNHPVAGRYALNRLTQLQPQNAQLQEAFQNIFGEASRIPEIARRGYTLQGHESSRPSAWHNALALADSGKLTEARKAFEELAKAPKADPLAWYNAGLIAAWQGENAKALDALNKYAELERDETKAVEAWALAEALRLGDDVLADSDYMLHRTVIQFNNGNAAVALLQQWEATGRLIGTRSNEEQGVLSGLVLEETTQLIGASVANYVPLAGYMVVAGNAISVFHPNAQSTAKLASEVTGKLGPAVVGSRTITTVAQFGDLVLEAMLFPTFGKASEFAFSKMKEQAQHYFEEVWIKRPLKGLAGNMPMDAAGSHILRRKVLGMVQLLEQCLNGSAPRGAEGDVNAPYDFNQLRHKLGLDSPALAPPGPVIDFGTLNAADLAALELEPLSSDQLEKGYRAALSLDLPEVAAKFVKALIARPSDPARPDLYPFYKFLIDQCQAQAKWDDAQAHVDEGLKADAERNGGKRQNDFELRRGQLFAKKGSVDQAVAAFEALIERVPQELKFRGSAAEAMLTLRQPAKTKQFAEAGLAEAVKQQNRDMEAYFRELVGAAKKQGG
jgi:tetratricopeptide (TPR) repeat protein